MAHLEEMRMELRLPRFRPLAIVGIFVSYCAAASGVRGQGMG